MIVTLPNAATAPAIGTTMLLSGGAVVLSGGGVITSMGKWSLPSTTNKGSLAQLCDIKECDVTTTYMHTNVLGTRSGRWLFD